MDLIAAQKLARELMQKHGLALWKFDFDRAARRFGSCSAGRKTITLSWKLTMLNGESQVRNTLLHEIAHALTPGDGHGPRWKRACIALGIKPERCFTEKDVAIPARRASRYEIGCEHCAWWHPRHRLSDRQMICKTCRGTILYRERMTGRRFRLGRGAKVLWLDQTTTHTSRSA